MNKIVRRDINGILLLDKTHGLTSNAALQRVKRLFNAKKAGHTGSLDPIATGMLPICFGEATKFSQYLLESDKSYFVTAKLGVRTNTADSEGEIISTQPVRDVNETRIQDVITQFTGEIEQIPPMFSAVKVQGKPLYELARRGVEVERKARRVQIFSIKFEKFDSEKEELSLTVHCSKGTYIRTLIEDMGAALGCGAHVIALRRLTVTPYDSAHMYSLSILESVAQSFGITGLEACLLPVETSVNIFPAITLSNSAAFYLRMGQAVRAPFSLDGALVRLMAEDGKFLGMGVTLQDGRVKPQRLLSLRIP